MQLCERYMSKDLPKTTNHNKEALASFEKMRPAVMTENEQGIVKKILLLEIGMAVRSMGNAKDWNNQDITMYISQVLDGFVVRFNKYSFASMLLFFKMRRARIEPCNTNTFGVNPMAILDEFNAFIEWQRTKVAESKRETGKSLRSDDLTKCLKDAPIHIQQGFANMKDRIAKLDKEKKQAAKKKAQMDFQVRRLQNILYMDMQDKAASEKRTIELLKAWQPKNAEDLKNMIDEAFNIKPKKHNFIYPSFDENGNVVVF